jgi:adenine-specific DNA-methyltransferase
MKEEDMLPYTIWDKPEYSASSMGTNLLTAMLGKKKFDYPKSLYAVMDTLRVLSSDKNAIILDFFAGSGTTGHAVLEMNKADKGRRSFILCTNNESDIAEEVTYPRIKSIVDGYKNVAGIPANLRYFKTDFVDRADTTDQTRVALVARATDMIKVRENTFDTVLEEDLLKVYASADQYSVIAFDPSVITKAKDHIAKLPEAKAVRVYVFSLANDTYESDFADLDRQIELRPIPESILEVYKRIFGKGGKND